MPFLRFLLFALPFAAVAQVRSFSNPILPGGYPDPSICRVGDDFYLVNSSFEYFPGLPIHHSKDLVNWEHIGYALHRTEQCTGAVNLTDVQQDGGIHAPSLRYHEGLFYLIVTNVYSPTDKSLPAEMVNFILTAEDPAGPWSDPHVIDGAPGIDPDLFFDDDGSAWFVGTHDVGQPDQNGIGEIWVQPLDLANWRLTGERTSVWRGACGGCCVEGPHIYRENGLYYLLVAEGGTGLDHAVMVAAGTQITGPYESCPRNPILTSRHLSRGFWVQNIGHADLVKLADGRWYLVALGVRNEVDGTTNMGRESHLVPVAWEPATIRWEETSPGTWEPLEYLWPVCAPETGRVERRTELPFPDRPQDRPEGFHDTFDEDRLHPRWNFRRVPKEGVFSLQAADGRLRLSLPPDTFQLRKRYGFIGFRQQHSDFDYRVNMTFAPAGEKAEAGIAVVQQDDFHLRFSLIREEGRPVLQLVLKDGSQAPLAIRREKLPSYAGKTVLRITARNGRYHYAYSVDDGVSFVHFAETADNLMLCRGYIGAQLGIYASANGLASADVADFEEVWYQGFPRE